MTAVVSHGDIVRKNLETPVFLEKNCSDIKYSSMVDRINPKLNFFELNDIRGVSRLRSGPPRFRYFT